ncbi:hypothetical protein Cgig2_008065 [Carnegiea gigantea]|uniref:Aminotransferase class V domain-containing protein n=1 Tax=Carnegiea gigantea TaxID=171969 RepID=A0A9Q1QTP0_9CARY|nr:hypothetical protein Cgig2_008065 [Carnegiea gigantea]
MEVPKICSKDTPEKKLSWLRSQIIGSTAEFNSPFGKRNTHTSDSYVGQHSTKMVEDAARYIKKYMGGGEQDAILFCGSGSTAAIKRLQEVMGIAVPSTLRGRVSEVLRDEERWVVFVGPYEHHSNLLSWRQSLAEVVEVGLAEDGGSIDLEALRVQLEHYAQTNRPMLGSFSACSNVTGIVTDTQALATLLHQYGAFACFDFAASGPYVELEMRSGEIDGYDAIFVSPHKFIGGPGSPGILLMSKKLYQLGTSAPSTCGGGTVSYVNGFSEEDTLYLDNIEGRENAGTPAIIQIIRAALAFWVKEHIGYETIVKQEHDHTVKALEKLGKIKNIRILGNTNVKRLSILSFLIYPSASNGNENNFKESPEKETNDQKPLSGRFVTKLLNDLFGIQTRGGCACAGPYGHHLLHVDKAYSLAFRSSIQKVTIPIYYTCPHDYMHIAQLGYKGAKPAWTRISLPYYMSSEEFEFVMKAVALVAVYGHRFLPYYDFNWRNGDWRFDEKRFKEALQRVKEDNNNKNNAINNDLHLLKLASLMQRLKFSNLNSGPQSPIKTESMQSDDDNKEEKDISFIFTKININDIDKSVTRSKYTTYLEEAVYIGSLLSNFPEQPRTEIPQDLFLDLPFKI